MVMIEDGGWIADLEAMTCRNILTSMVVEFEKSGSSYVGKVKDMPIGIMEQWAKLRHGERLMKNAVAEAEEVFLRAAIERDIEQGEPV
jgi:predicted alpha/beta hydrolase